MNKQSLRLDYVGDIALGPALRATLAERGAAFITAPWRDAFEGADLAIANHEYTYQPPVPSPAARPSRLIAAPSVADLWPDLPFDVATLANNHIGDAGPPGALFARELLEARGISCIGAGRDLAHALTPLISEVKGWRIAHIGACEFPFFYADAQTPGAAPMTMDALTGAIAAVRSAVDLVVIVLHSDVEFVRYPSPFRRDFSRRLIDAGADLVIQHHPHVLQGVETYNDGLIAYSLGNFLFAVRGSRYLSEHAGTTDAAILRVTIDPAGQGGRSIRHEWVPFVLDDFGRPCEPDAAERSRILGEVNELTATLHDEAALRRCWRATARQQLTYNLRHTYYACHHEGLRQGIRFFTNMYGKRETHHWLRAFFA
jgi:poly-gamma-glutamate synthesis protein (capsule biosynthesis protein)